MLRNVNSVNTIPLPVSAYKKFLLVHKQAKHN